MNCINALNSISKFRSKYFIPLTIIFLVNCCLLFAQETLSDEILNQLKILKKELSQAEKDLDVIRDRVYDENPPFKYSVELLRKAEQEDHDITQDRIEVMRYLSLQHKTHPEIKQLYWDLRGFLAESLEYDNARSILEDPQKRPLILAIIKAYSSYDNENVTEDDLVDTYLNSLKAVQESNEIKIQEIEKMGILPDFVFDHVKNEARVSSLRSFSDVYIRLNKPEELQLAESKVSNLKAKMTQLFPDWYKLQIELEAITEDVINLSIIENDFTAQPSEGIKKTSKTSKASEFELPNNLTRKKANTDKNASFRLNYVLRITVPIVLVLLSALLIIFYRSKTNNILKFARKQNNK